MATGFVHQAVFFEDALAVACGLRFEVQACFFNSILLGVSAGVEAKECKLQLIIYVKDL